VAPGHLAASLNVGRQYSRLGTERLEDQGQRVIGEGGELVPIAYTTPGTQETFRGAKSDAQSQHRTGGASGGSRSGDADGAKSSRGDWP
jgi:hypothetical protein